MRDAPGSIAELNTAAVTLDEAARDIAIAISAAIHGDEVMIGPISAIAAADGTLAVHLALARRSGPLLFADLVPGTLDISSAKMRERFRAAIAAALARCYRRARSFNSFHALLDAATAPRERDAQLKLRSTQALPGK